MKHQAHIEDDWQRNGVQVALIMDGGNRERTLYDFSGVVMTTYEPDGPTRPGDDTRLALPYDAARALYEALADHFGHAGHDARALRRDYEAERKRVDTFIAHLTGPRA